LAQGHAPHKLGAVGRGAAARSTDGQVGLILKENGWNQ